MRVSVNGAEEDLVEGATIADVLSHLGREPQGRGIAVAVNGEVVPRAEWVGRSLQPGDRVEVLDAVGGG